MNRGCQTMSGKRQPGEGFDSRLKNPKCANAACSLACQRSPWRTRIHDSVRDSLARQLHRMGATVDLERVAPQLSKRCRDNNGTVKIRVVRIDVVATIAGSNELQLLDIKIRRPTALTKMEGAARAGGHAATQGEREKTKKYRKQKRGRP